MRNALWFFLFEEPRERVDRIRRRRVGVRLRPRTRGRASGSHATQFRLEHVSRQPANIRNKFGIGRGALDLEWDAQAALAPTAGNFAQKTAEASTGAS